MKDTLDYVLEGFDTEPCHRKAYKYALQELKFIRYMKDKYPTSGFDEWEKRLIDYANRRRFLIIPNWYERLIDSIKDLWRRG